jgi:hypothetical protein
MSGGMAQGRSQTRHRTITFGFVAAGLGMVTIVVYLLLINSQTDGTEERRVEFVASFVGLMAVLSLAGALGAALNSGVSRAILLAAATGNMGMGVLGLFSIGAPLLVAGGLLFAAEPFSGDHPWLNLLAPALVLIVLAFGIALTS